ncbi:MAG: 1L-myo-inositol 1-phosphate cytidylyltransferase [Sphingomonadales bacterium]|jgi:choline kinase|nr:1L-myo-inositol 1-phosphate cytidylyltransferase [Sphingomonadales bacterium]
MKCLIIAAGQGTRLRSIAPSKPLARVAGLPLIEHVVRRAAAGGASGFVVVTGYEPEPLEAFLAELAEASGLSIEVVRNPDWHRPNGLSVLAAGAQLEGEFILLMSDHLFDPDILADMIAADRSAAALTLGADHAVDNPLLDLDDATKIELGEGGRIRRIGKTLARYDAIDTGIFIAGPELLEALRASLAAGGLGSLSEGVQALAEAGRAFTRDIGGRWWLDVDDEAAFAKAEAALA